MDKDDDDAQFNPFILLLMNDKSSFEYSSLLILKKDKKPMPFFHKNRLF